MLKNTFLKTLVLCIFFAFLLLALNFILVAKVRIDKALGGASQKTQANAPSYIGEKITYNVTLGGLRLGKAYFSSIDNAEINGRVLNVMLFETKLARFKDTEKIYSDPQTLLPIRVERDILNWFTREKITEDYDQEKFTVTIIKNKGTRQETMVIKKDGFIHNAILLPYYVRRLPEIDTVKTIIANLPTRRLHITLASTEDVSVPAGTFRAYHFTSTPKQIDIWISADERRIPLKIKGTGAFGYSMEMKEYSFKP
ncbi:MAG: DUF3108 domain-containing protein [Candidatus Omnitrophota bacterium]